MILGNVSCGFLELYVRAFLWFALNFSFNPSVSCSLVTIVKCRKLFSYSIVIFNRYYVFSLIDLFYVIEF